MRNLKITHCPTSEKSAKGADKHLGTELHTLGFELATSRLVEMTGAVANHSGITVECGKRLPMIPGWSFRELLALVSRIYRRVVVVLLRSRSLLSVSPSSE